MRKFLNICLLAVFSIAATVTVTPRVQATSQYSYYTDFYNYGSRDPDGNTLLDCHHQFSSSGDTEPTQIGELKVVYTVDCASWVVVSYQWYRWGMAGCSPPDWNPISDPYYDNTVPC